jgi:hypothetical protein
LVESFNQERDMNIANIFLMVFCFCVAEFANAQMTSRGPGKGPPTPGSGSKYTYPQPKKVTATLPESINPAYQVPEYPEKSVWRLSTKNYATGANKSDVPVYMIRNGRRSMAGLAKVGEEITLEEMTVSKDRVHYKFAWKGGSDKPQQPGSSQEYWIDGVNIEYAGKR